MPKIGTVTLNGATAVIEATTTVTAAGHSFLTVQAPGATLVGVGCVSARTPARPTASRSSPVTPRPWPG